MKLIDKKNKIYLLNEDSIKFPNIEMMNSDLVALGGDFRQERLIEAYNNGIFPWFIDKNGCIHWFCPKKRMILYPNKLIISKSLRKSILNKGFIIKYNSNFEEVIQNCSTAKRKHEDGTWITNDFIRAYINLYKLNISISVECYLNDELVGGLYGIRVGNIFCGESMFSKISDASKVALYNLCNNQTWIKLIDCQVYNKHLESLGAFEVDRKDYLEILKDKKDFV